MINLKLLAKNEATHKQAGFSMPTVLSFMLAMAIISVSVMSVVLDNFSQSGMVIKRQEALNIAEAGVNYYLWHMAHNSNDYKDGNSTPTVQDPKYGFGPYDHEYYDVDGTKKGTYTLWIKPSGDGSTIVTVRSVGKTEDGTSRTIETKIGAASFASYGLLADVEFWFGQSESADGPVFSNIHDIPKFFFTPVQSLINIFS